LSFADPSEMDKFQSIMQAETFGGTMSRLFGGDSLVEQNSLD